MEDQLASIAVRVQFVLDRRRKMNVRRYDDDVLDLPIVQELHQIEQLPLKAGLR
jgi:hypothetical protein